MATVYVTEYSNVAAVGNSSGQAVVPGQAPQEPYLATQTVAITTASVQSAAVNANTRLVRLHTDAICSVAFGTSPTATSTNARLAANQTEYFGVPQGLGFKVAVITNS